MNTQKIEPGLEGDLKSSVMPTPIIKSLPIIVSYSELMKGEFMKSTKIIELIYTEERIGIGKDNDPIRCLPQLYTKDGYLVAEIDPCKGNKSAFFDPEKIFR